MPKKGDPPQRNGGMKPVKRPPYTPAPRVPVPPPAPKKDGK